MIQFKISAPGRLSLFGEEAVKYDRRGLITAIDLRTTLQFKELPSANSTIEIDFPRINLFFRLSLQKFLEFYSDCVKNMELLREQVLQFMDESRYNTDIKNTILRTFFYLLVYITYHEQIKMKSFAIHISSELVSKEEFLCPTAFVVCLTACLLHWSRTQKDIFDFTFHEDNLVKIQIFAGLCLREITSKFGLSDATVCTYGGIIRYQFGEQNNHLTIPFILSLTNILLVDLQKIQNLKIPTQQIAKLMNEFPEIGNELLDSINDVTNFAFDIFQQLINIYKNTDNCSEFDSITDNKINIRQTLIAPLLKNNTISEKEKQLNECIRRNNMLLKLRVRQCHLDEICLITQIFQCDGKYTDIGNGRYAYILCPNLSSRQIILLSDKLKSYGYGVIGTTLARSGVSIDSMTYSRS